MESEGDRRPELARLTMPTAVIHGRADRLLPFGAGIATAQAIPDAELYLYAGLGHEMARVLWPQFTQVLLRTAKRAAA
jgi:pimeloyl-ACP methyl ester carboxylesterase